MAVRARRRIAPGYALSAVCCEARCGTPMAGECIIGISQEPRCPPDMLEAAAGFGDENPIGCTACSKKLSEQHRIEQEQRQAAFFRGKRREGPAVCKNRRRTGRRISGPPAKNQQWTRRGKWSEMTDIQEAHAGQERTC
eukprot:3100135-Rhodomonas_salina.2